MAVRAFGTRKRRNEGRWLLASVLMASTALVVVPKAEAAGEVVTPSPGSGTQYYYAIPALSADGTIYLANGYDPTDGRDFADHVGPDGGRPILGPSVAYWGSGMSGDGRYVAGTFFDPDGRRRAFRWDADSGEAIDLGLIYPAISSASAGAHDVSGDGRKVVGEYFRPGMLRGFVWIEGATTGMTDNEQIYLLKGLTAASSWWAASISDDGNFATGTSNGDATLGRAVRWDLRGLEAGGVGADILLDLGSLTGMDIGESSARDISADGTVVVGSSWNEDGFEEAFRWVEGGSGGYAGNPQMYGLGFLAAGHDVGRFSRAHSVSRDGRYVVGVSGGDAMAELAFRWTEEGMESVADWLGRNGVDVGDLFLYNATAVSDDGNVIAGTMTGPDGNDRAYIARVVAPDPGPGPDPDPDPGPGPGPDPGPGPGPDPDPGPGPGPDPDPGPGPGPDPDPGPGPGPDPDPGPGPDPDPGPGPDPDPGPGPGPDPDPGPGPGPDPDPGPGPGPDPDPGPGPVGGGLMDVEEYHRSLYGAAGIANAGEFLAWLPMNGAHHRPLMLTPSLSGDMCAWATGDFAQHGPSATGLALAEMGACIDLAGGNVRIGGAVGTSGSWQELALGGSARMQGQYVLSEIDWQPDGTPLLLSVTGMLGSYKADIARAYSNGAATAISNGETNAFGGVVRVRADWLEAALIGNTSINPYASLAFGGLHIDGYTESGGPFPAVFNEQKLRHADIRLGVTAVSELSASTRLSTTLEVAHRSGDAAAASGNVPGLFNFNLGGGSYAQSWVRAGLELDHKINDAVSVSASAHLASHGRDPSLVVSAGLKGAF